jgi:NADPH-dependent 7-cyano-7-deazaguanine reductase QueF
MTAGFHGMKTVLAPSGIEVVALFDITHRCPFRDEIDQGSIEIAWRTDTRTIELHWLASVLRDWSECAISHEQYTSQIRDDLDALFGFDLVRVRSEWRTAGATVVVTADALLREPIHAQGA